MDQAGGARDARAEARRRVGGRLDVRVLEPSPPAVAEAPFYADDPLDGGAVLPVPRPGARTWADVCDGSADADLRPWCQDRWLVRGPLPELPAGLAATRVGLHRLAEHVLAPCRHAANGKIGLRYTYRGFGTPFFGPDRQVRMEEDELVDGDRRLRPSSLASAAAFLGLGAPAPTGLYPPTTPVEAEGPLVIDRASARALGDWFGFCTSVLEELRAGAAEAGAAERVQLWPEHFDVGLGLGEGAARADYGGSPGDQHHPEPYLYVGPWEPRTGPFWNEPFGASLSYRDLLAGADPLAFLRTGRGLLEP